MLGSSEEVGEHRDCCLRSGLIGVLVVDWADGLVLFGFLVEVASGESSV